MGMIDPQLAQFQKTREELDAITRDLLNEVDSMKRNLRALDWQKWERPTVDYLVSQGHKWEKWYAWRPIKLHTGGWTWRKDVFRLLGNTYMDHDSANWYYYGTILDVLKDTQ